MIRRTCLAAILAFSTLTILSCGGGGGHGGSSPTESGGKHLTIGFGLAALSGGVVQTAAVSVDNREIGRKEFGNAGCALNCQVIAETERFGAGSHTVAVTIVRQSQGSVRYQVFGTGVVVDTVTGASQAITLGTKTVTLAAGGSVPYGISF
ncbi:MAG TPA: hypothetical protein VLB76_26825 [Thermoanaerobaculia bacterium]|jgi:hypothetical protein|nr:hypothetical protein [Thermoanaerobaculia bacterium]